MDADGYDPIWSTILPRVCRPATRSRASRTCSKGSTASTLGAQLARFDQPADRLQYLPVDVGVERFTLDAAPQVGGSADQEDRPAVFAHRADGSVAGLAASSIEEHVDAARNYGKNLLDPVVGVIVEHLTGTQAGAPDPAITTERSDVTPQMRAMPVKLNPYRACVQGGKYDLLAFKAALRLLLADLDDAPALRRFATPSPRGVADRGCSGVVVLGSAQDRPRPLAGSESTTYSRLASRPCPSDQVSRSAQDIIGSLMVRTQCIRSARLMAARRCPHGRGTEAAPRARPSSTRLQCRR